MVTIISSFIEKFTVFIIVGIIFIFIGLSKFIIFKGKKEKQIENKIEQDHSKQKYITCPHCKAYNFPNSEFCHYCGRKLR